MAKKRIIFVLLYDQGHFSLSRNFTLQRVGDLEWLNKNYNFENVSRFIDELVVLNVTRESDLDWNLFVQTVRAIAEQTFVPIAVGGFNQDVRLAHNLLRSGADRLVVNSALFENIEFVTHLVAEYGRQSIVGSIDVQIVGNEWNSVLTRKGSRTLGVHDSKIFDSFPSELVGEILLRSIRRDGTGQGLDFEMVGLRPESLSSLPLILSGGIGKAEHMVEGLQLPTVSGVATANLFNFVGSGLSDARSTVIESGIDLATWL